MLKKIIGQRVLGCLCTFWVLTSVSADTHYVAPGGGDRPPYTNWTDAARILQSAIDAAASGDLVLVSNGVYNVGGVVTFGALTNRVALTKPIALRSVHGPSTTWIRGAANPTTTNGNAAVRCVYMTNGASLVGFRLYDGHTRTNGVNEDRCGGALWCASRDCFITNCIIEHCTADLRGGAVYQGTLYNCIMRTNACAESGGACYDSLLYGCELHANSARYGGGARLGNANACQWLNNHATINGGASYETTCIGGTLCSNTALQSGGAMYQAHARGCLLTGNSAGMLGGACFETTVSNCILRYNKATTQGGAGYGGAFFHSALYGNQANHGGGTYNSHLYHATVYDNTANQAGGCYGGRLYNSIIYYNQATTAPNTENVIAEHCCAPNLDGIHIALAPRLLDPAHIALDSPCIAAGNPLYSAGADIDGEHWANPPCLGCDQVTDAPKTGDLVLAISLDYNQAAPGFTLSCKGVVQGTPAGCVWDFGNGVRVSNTLVTSCAWPQTGTYPVIYHAWNHTHPAGVAVTSMVEIIDEQRYVAAQNPNAALPYNSWSNAASQIQDALDACHSAGARIWVGPGVYNSITISNPANLYGVNGPAQTVIDGAGANRCVWLGPRTSLSHFTITNGWATGSGGGILVEHTHTKHFYIDSATISNCVVAGCVARNGGGVSGGRLIGCTLRANQAWESGGGGYQAHLSRCVITANRSENYGGGCWHCTIDHSLIVSNTASIGGGCAICNLNHATICANTALIGGGCYMVNAQNSIVYYNTSDNYVDAVMTHVCTTPLPSGNGHLTNAPNFVNADAGNYRLHVESPCIDRGIFQGYDTDEKELDNRPRIFNGTPDLGAYEYSVRLHPRIWLQGPYDTTLHGMHSSLSAKGLLPLDSPYGHDRRQRQTTATNIVDWVLIELMETNRMQVLAAVAGLLRSDGVLLDADGTAGVYLHAPPNGHYSLVVKHRNHAAIPLPTPVAYTNEELFLDFSTVTNGAINMEPGRWGLPAGDADGSGKITAIDATIRRLSAGKTGYQPADFNLDGHVSSEEASSNE